MLKKDGKPVTFGPGLFKSKGNSRQELLDRLTRAIGINTRNDRDLIFRAQEQQKKQQAKAQKNAINIGLATYLGQGLLGDSIKDGSKYIANSIFGDGTAAPIGEASSTGKGFFSNLFGGGSGNTASKLTTPGETPSFMSGYSGGYPGPVNPTPPVTPAANQGGFFSNLWGGGEGGNATGVTPGSETFATYGIPAAAAAATYLAGKSALDTLQGKTDNSSSGKFGRGQLAFTTMGLSELGRLLGGPNQDKWDTERKRLQKLKDQGIAVPQELIDSMPKSSQSVNDLINKQYAMDYIGRDQNKNWVNNQFAQSRDEKDLRPEDVAGYASFIEKFGNNYLNAPMDVKLKVAQEALNKGLINEHNGTIDIADDNDFNTYARQLLGY